VIFGSVDTRISYIFEMFLQTYFRMRLHPSLFKHTYKKYKCQNNTLGPPLPSKF
jgi:hypothetical protein